MTATPKKSASAASSKVQAIRPVAKAVEPPEGWKLQSEFGFMRLDESPAGALVRLADVLHWLEASRSVPRVAALGVLCAAMSPDVMQWLYWAQPTDYAKPVPVDHMWGYQTAAQIEAKKAQDRQAVMQRDYEDEQSSRGGFRGFRTLNVQAGRISTTSPAPTEPGLPALLKLIRLRWSQAKFNRASKVDILDDPRIANLSLLAIRMDKAFELWSYGRLAGAVAVPETEVVAEPQNWAELVQYRKTHSRPSWTADMKRILATREESEKKKPGSKGVREAMAKELSDISAKRVGQLIRELENPPKNQRTGTR